MSNSMDKARVGLSISATEFSRQFSADRLKDIDAHVNQDFEVLTTALASHCQEPTLESQQSLREEFDEKSQTLQAVETNIQQYQEQIATYTQLHEEQTSLEAENEQDEATLESLALLPMLRKVYQHTPDFILTKLPSVQTEKYRQADEISLRIANRDRRIHTVQMELRYLQRADIELSIAQEREKQVRLQAEIADLLVKLEGKVSFEQVADEKVMADFVAHVRQELSTYQQQVTEVLLAVLHETIAPPLAEASMQGQSLIINDTVQLGAAYVAELITTQKGKELNKMLGDRLGINTPLHAEQNLFSRLTRESTANGLAACNTQEGDQRSKIVGMICKSMVQAGLISSEQLVGSISAEVESVIWESRSNGTDHLDSFHERQLKLISTFCGELDDDENERIATLLGDSFNGRLFEKPSPQKLASIWSQLSGVDGKFRAKMLEQQRVGVCEAINIFTRLLQGLHMEQTSSVIAEASNRLMSGDTRYLWLNDQKQLVLGSDCIAHLLSSKSVSDSGFSVLFLSKGALDVADEYVEKTFGSSQEKNITKSTRIEYSIQENTFTKFCRAIYSVEDDALYDRSQIARVAAEQPQLMVRKDGKIKLRRQVINHITNPHTIGWLSKNDLLYTPESEGQSDAGVVEDAGERDLGQNDLNSLELSCFSLLSESGIYSVQTDRAKIRRVLRKHLPELTLSGKYLMVTPQFVDDLCTATGAESQTHRVYKQLYSEESTFRLRPQVLESIQNWSDKTFNEFVSFGLLQKESLLDPESTALLRSAVIVVESAAKGLKTIVDGHALAGLVADKQIGHLITFAVDFNRLGISADTEIPQLSARAQVLAALKHTQLSSYEQQQIASHLFLQSEWKVVESKAATPMETISCWRLKNLKHKLIFPIFQALEKSGLLDQKTVPASLNSLRQIFPDVLMPQLFGAYFKSEEPDEFEFGSVVQSLTITESSMVVNVKKMRAESVALIRQLQPQIEALGFVVTFTNHEEADKVLEEESTILALVAKFKETQFIQEGDEVLTEQEVTWWLQEQVKDGLELTQIDDRIRISGDVDKYWDVFFSGRAYWTLLTERSKWQSLGIDIDLPEPALFENAEKKAEIFAAGFPSYKHRRSGQVEADYVDGVPVWRHMTYFSSATEQATKAAEKGKKLPTVRFDLAENCPFELQSSGVNRDFLQVFSKLQDAVESTQDQNIKGMYVDLLKQFGNLSEFQSHLHVESDGGKLAATIDFKIFEDLFSRSAQNYGTVASFLTFCFDLAQHPIAIEGFSLQIDFSQHPDAAQKIAQISKLIRVFTYDERRYFYDFCIQKLKADDWQQQADELIALFDIRENQINCQGAFYDYLIKDLQNGNVSLHSVTDQFQQIERNNLFAQNLKPDEADFFSFVGQLATYNATDSVRSLTQNWIPGESNPAMQNYKNLLKKETAGKNDGSRWTLSSQGFVFFKDDERARQLLIDLNSQGRLRIDTQTVIMKLIDLSGQSLPSYETMALLESLSDKSATEIVELILQKQSVLAARSVEITTSFAQSPLANQPEQRVVFYSYLISLTQQTRVDDQKIDFMLQLLTQNASLLGDQKFMKVIKPLEDVVKEPGGIDRAFEFVNEFPRLYDAAGHDSYDANEMQNFLADVVLRSEHVRTPKTEQDFIFAKQIVHLYESEKESKAFQAMVRASLSGKIPRELALSVASQPVLARYHESLLKQPDVFFASEERIMVLARILEKLSKQSGVGTLLLEAVAAKKITIEYLELIADRLLKLPSSFIAHMLSYKNTAGELEYFINPDALSFAESLNHRGNETERVKILELAGARALAGNKTGDVKLDTQQSRFRAQELVKPKRLRTIVAEMLKYPRSFLVTDKSIDVDFPLVSGAYQSEAKKDFFAPVCEVMETGLLDAQQAALLPDTLPQLMVKKRTDSFKFGLLIAKDAVRFSIANEQLDVLSDISRTAKDKNLDQGLGRAFLNGSKSERSQKDVRLMLAMKEQLSDTSVFDTQPVVMTDANWAQMMLLFMMLGENSSFVTIKPEHAQIVKKLFEEKVTKDFCLKKIRQNWGSYLRADEPMSMPLSSLATSHTMEEFGGPGPLKHIGALLSFQHEISKAYRSGTTLDGMKVSIKESLLTLEQRFDKDGWSDDDRSYFYGLSTDLIAASPSVFLEFVKGLTVQNENVAARFTPKELKAFTKDILPLYQARLALIGSTDGKNVTHPLRELATIRRDVRQFFTDANQHEGEGRASDLEQHRGELLQLIKKFFAEKYGIIKLPENLDGEDVRSIQNLSKYVTNISKKNESKFSVDREQILALFLALKINGLWETFRAGGDVDLQSLFTPEKAAVLQPLLEKRASMNVITSEVAQIPQERMGMLQKTLQLDVENVHLSNVMTVDEKLVAVMGGLRSLIDQDAYETAEEKNFLALYQKHSSEVMIKVIGMLFREFGGNKIEYTPEQAAAVTDLKAMVALFEMPWSLESIKKLQDSMQHIRVVSTLVDSLEKNNVDAHLAELREILKPNEAVVAIFSRIGEGFQAGSGAYALSQDLNELQNVVVKHKDELTEEEFGILQDYLKNIRVKIEFLETLLADIGTRFVKLKGSDKIKKDSLLDQKIAEASKVVEVQGLAQQVTTRMTGDINLIIENMRACLGPSRKEVNNDTSLTFGDSKFFIISQGESRKGSFADQIVYLEPIKTASGNWELSFIMDGLYGTQTPEVLANHIRTVLKKMRAIKGVVEKCPISLTITADALGSCAAGHNGEFVMNKLAAENDLAGFVVEQVTDAVVNIAPSALADHYVEFGETKGRFSGETKIAGLVVRLV